MKKILFSLFASLSVCAQISAPPGNVPAGGAGKMLGYGSGGVAGASNLEDDVGYYTSANTEICAEGDSIMAGYSTTLTNSPLGRLFANHLTGANWFYGINSAVVGSDVPTMAGRYAANIFPHRPAATGKQAILIVGIGINDLRVGATAATTFGLLSNYFNTARADGFKILAVTLGGSTDLTAAKEGERIRFNRLLRRANNLWDWCYDWTADLPPPPSAFHSDFIHPNATGYDLYALGLNCTLRRGIGNIYPRTPGVTGPARFSIGSAPAPGLTIGDDLDSGFLEQFDNFWDFSAGGTLGLRLYSAGLAVPAPGGLYFPSGLLDASSIAGGLEYDSAGNVKTVADNLHNLGNHRAARYYVGAGSGAMGIGGSSASGNPEGVVSMDAGSLFFAGTSPQSLYFKQTGTGNTGWSPVRVGKAAVKSADQSVTSSTTLVDATDLSAAVLANKTYRIRGVIFFATAASVSGVKFGVNGPTSPTSVFLGSNIMTGANGVSSVVATAYNVAIHSGSGATIGTGARYWYLDGILINGANAGTLQIQFAQATSDAGAVTVNRGSIFEVELLN
jgi:hypothetical protein